MADEATNPTHAGREALLAAGAELVAELRARDVLPGVRQVCRGSGMGTGAFYRCFDDLEAYHVALVAWVADHARTNELSAEARDAVVAVADEIARSAPPGGEAASRVAAAAGINVDDQVGPAAADNRVQFLLTSLSHGDDPVAEAIRQGFQRFYERICANQTAGIESLVVSLGGKVRPPFTARSVAYIVCAVIEGVLLRSQIDPAFDATTVVEDTTRVLFIALLAEATDPEDIDTLVGRALDAVRDDQRSAQ